MVDEGVQRKHGMQPSKKIVVSYGWITKMLRSVQFWEVKLQMSYRKNATEDRKDNDDNDDNDDLNITSCPSDLEYYVQLLTHPLH